jgi:hypothetical protein
MSTQNQLDLVEGWTGPLDFDLLADNATPSSAMTGMSVVLLLREESGHDVTIGGTVGILDAAAWRIRYSPANGDLVAGKYGARFKVMDTGGKIVFFPNGPADRWVIRAH